MVNWHPLGTIWHPLEGPGLLLLLLLFVFKFFVTTEVPPAPSVNMATPDKVFWRRFFRFIFLGVNQTSRVSLVFRNCFWVVKDLGYENISFEPRFGADAVNLSCFLLAFVATWRCPPFRANEFLQANCKKGMTWPQVCPFFYAKHRIA